MSEDITHILIVAPSLIVGDNFIEKIEHSPYQDLQVLPASAGIHGLHKIRGQRFDHVIFLREWDRGVNEYIRQEFLGKIDDRRK